MPIIINCPQCRGQLKVPDELLGQDVQCPTCQALFTATENSGALPSSSPGTNENFERDDRPKRAPMDWDDEPIEDQDDLERRYRRRDLPETSVAGPAIALMITGGLAFLLSLLSFVINLAMPAMLAAGGPKGARFESTLLGLGGAAFGLCWGGFIFFGAWQMHNHRNYGLAMASAIVAMLPCNGCCLLGLPFGIWALVMLNKPEVKEAFR